MPRIEFVNNSALLYRVGAKTGGQGLWYDQDGNPTGLINTLSEGNARFLPMGRDPVFRSDRRDWISVTDRLADLGLWFSRQDILELVERGYVMQEIEVSRYRRFHFPAYSHAVYCREDVIDMREIEPMSPFVVDSVS